MKLNKFSVGFGIALLGAVSAFATTKTHRFGSYFYASGGVCNPITIEDNCTPGGTSCKGEAGTPAAGLTLFQRVSTTGERTCSIPLQLETGF